MSWCVVWLLWTCGQHYPGLPFIHTTPPPPIPSFQSGDIPPWSTVDFKNGYFGPHRSNAYCLREVGVGGGRCYVTVCVFLREV